MIETEIGLLRDRKINNWYFEYDAEELFYSCRGDVVYDDDHDARCESRLVEAGMILENQLTEEGFIANLDEGEKGWVYITIQN